ncbi:hypothetical protein BO221_33140 [Archangium sp. Cb G35]|nr:hypothetical protein BO221_33140 [Archangium sp. Cb G35]
MRRILQAVEPWSEWRASLFPQYEVCLPRTDAFHQCGFPERFAHSHVRRVLAVRQWAAQRLRQSLWSYFLDLAYAVSPRHDEPWVVGTINRVHGLVTFERKFLGDLNLGADVNGVCPHEGVVAATSQAHLKRRPFFVLLTFFQTQCIVGAALQPCPLT